MAKAQSPLHIKAIGFSYILLGSLSLTYVVVGLTPQEVLWLMIIVWVTDIMAFVVGSQLKGPQFAPRISPKKTWSGFLGGVLSAMCASYVYAHYFLNDKSHILWLSLVLSLSVHYGDLLESWLKRSFQVKDSGALIPGHGGIFDRVDGVLAASLVFVAVHFMLV
jgi:phosphatidate cytidylyltransferase